MGVVRLAAATITPFCDHLVDSKHQASLRERVGVYSFARYDPSFYGEYTTNRARLMLRRGCKVLAHERGHMFGIAHGIYFPYLIGVFLRLRISPRSMTTSCS
jgi:archaemetzincin